MNGRVVAAIALAFHTHVLSPLHLRSDHPMSLETPRYLVPFDPKRIPHHFIDVLIIGGGIAGLRAAMEIDPELSLLVVGSYRDDERPNLPEELPEIQVMRLDRLDAEAIHALSVSMLGESGSEPEVVDLLQRETEGNVFFLVEVVRVLASEAGRLSDVGASGGIAVGRTGALRPILRE